MWCKETLVQTLSELDFNVDIVESIFRTISIFDFHKSEACSLIHKLEPHSDEAALMSILCPDGESYVNKLALQAHVQAAIHNARSVYDLLAQLINQVLLNSTLEVHSCDIKKVLSQLENSPVKDAINQAVGSESYSYVNSFVNVIKHRNLVVLKSEANFEELKAGIRFSSFKYRKTSYPSLWATDVLQRSIDVRNEIVDIGIALNEHLKQQRV
ncbi:hypothetical protein K6675_004676 [Vibrio parahaemolyticus]|nr:MULTISPECIES: hypothetical protein [Vibrio harveyi group]EHU5129757.1 hypothetical protein [Vibrio vulnificus]EGR2205828.1 hypothetical protein [Vibrio parahaemolyticus]EHH1246717.1 hypothetical protein [Vibrio parahaemolyticus]EHH3742170.1 hypothetical protein [Vibrio parahaemolyticus]EHJ9985832.1 hypothetical protein [Vibrio parahaemolyticus]